MSAPLPCGVFWFLHIGKTGGTTVHYFLRSTAKQGKWTFVDLWSDPCDPLLASPNMTEWGRSPTWQPAARELGKRRPFLLVHQHHCSPGMGAALLPQLQQLKHEMGLRGCSLALGTVLRDPVSRVLSSEQFNAIPRAKLRRHVTFPANTNEQAKYLVHGFWGTQTFALRQELARPRHAAILRSRALQTLSAFELVGRTDRLASFVASLARLLGVAPPDTLPRMFGETYIRNGMEWKRDRFGNFYRPFELTEGSRSWIRQHNLADEWLWKQTMPRFV